MGASSSCSSVRVESELEFVRADLGQPFQVNGKDVSQCSHDEAVAAFQSAREPIVVEVLRRVSSDRSPMKARSPPRVPSPVMADAVTQTEEFIENSYFDLFHANGYPLGSMVQSPNGLPFPPPSELGLTDLDMSNGLDYDAEFDPERAFDMEYEEVTLHRQSSEQKVGLTLCYGSADDEITDIFVGEIESCSIAAEDGRIREGDQILQINGEDVRTREEAIKLFSENRSDITLLLSRQIVQVDDGFMDERAAFDDLQVLDPRMHQHKLELTSAMLGQDRHLDEECGTTDTATTECSQKHEKDSGVGKTDGDSTRNDESSEQEMIESEMISPMNSNDHHYSNESFTSNDLGVNDIPAEECQKFLEVLETRCSSASDGSSPSRRQKTPRKDSQSSIEREIAALNQEMEQIQLQCQEIVDTHSKEQQRVGKQSELLRNAEPGFRSPRMVPRMGTRLDHLKQLQGQVPAPQECEPPLWVRQEHLARVANQVHREATTVVVAADHNRNTKPDESKESNSSAYNTGESMRSTPLTFELHNDQNASMLSLNANAEDHRASTIYDEDLYAEIPCVSESQSTLSVSRMSQTEEDAAKESLHELYTQYADVMYTNRANLQHTIMVQQKLFQQQLMQRARSRQQQQEHEQHEQQQKQPQQQQQHHHRKSKTRKGEESPHSRSSSSSKGRSADKSSRSNSGNRSASSGEIQEGVKNDDSASGMEWVVKRRADGSRYITRRPVRNRLLKERAKKVNEERCGLTTDDDAMSELKVGRYWNKEDRKRHLEKSRDRKVKKEAMIRQRMETVKETEEGGKKEPNIVELSHRKMMRHKNKKVLDDFTTIHEMLAHGARDQNPKATYNPLLSVTTV